MDKFAHVINKLENIPSIDDGYIFSQINKFIEECKLEAKADDGTPDWQHLTSKFILKDLAHLNKLYVVRYEFDSKNVLKKPRSIGYQSPKSFSRIKGFYSVTGNENNNTSGSEDEFRVEKLLSAIETRAAPLIKTRQRNSVNSKVRSNPYFYEEDESYLDEYGIHKSYFTTQELQRVTLAVFFGAQYLRSLLMYNSFNNSMETNLLQNYEDQYLGKFEGKYFGEYIEWLLPMAALKFYFRSWRWVYSKHDLFIPSGTSLVAFMDHSAEHPFKEKALCMPLGKNIGIYFSREDSFSTSHDGVSYSKSLVLNSAIIKNLMFFATIDAVSPTSHKDKNGIRKFEIAMSPNSNLAYAIKTDKDPEKKLDEILASLTAPSRKQYDKDLNFLAPIPRFSILQTKSNT